jgi:DNA-binding IclR family transcriptional regulator
MIMSIQPSPLTSPALLTENPAVSKVLVMLSASGVVAKVEMSFWYSAKLPVVELALRPSQNQDLLRWSKAERRLSTQKYVAVDA